MPPRHIPTKLRQPHRFDAVAVAAGAALALTVTAGLAPAIRAEQARPVAGEITVAGRERRFLLYVPAAARTPGRPLPLVLVLHGGGGRAWQMPRFTGFSRLADRAGFVVTYPQGVRRQWNDGRVGRRSRADDVAFLTALVRHIARRTGRVDRRRVFVAGISNGGFMAMRLACEAPGVFLGIAAVTAQFTAWHKANCRPARPVSVLVMNGTRDPLVPYGGGVVAPQFGGRGRAISTGETMAFWAGHNRCAASPALRPVPDRNRDDASRIFRHDWDGCAGGAKVRLYRVEGGGHTWPGTRQYLPAALIGPTNRDLDGTVAIWRFFRSLPVRARR